MKPFKHAAPAAPLAPALIPSTYRPPLERVCGTCGGKHVGSCDREACSDIGRMGREG